ncbi:tryptophan--tRNA ligase [Candidatus Karelsulcia muelleri]|uniref:Tryptophan--tRNA ligase n=1 Tax=Candidatus Karelsulcia muelleri TaxID=336810 RepID=A0A346E0U6_9FLAO|nr:tryptophan--tRNA ligase [Candidatus Karelsulcia muelleri]AXN02601.1 Tryptophanyl-tRNA synthetase [Candidatus Karelsulcia muelleri]WDI79542.1 tryptophan--tRNA ligase [Candidatus Karelsulcia muelleri]WDR78999.1 tryptophan--tRNA ligase [Candidatus Karelsulcia muelleri]
MDNLLTGIKSTGRPHLGHVIGIISPTIFLINKEMFHKQFILIANLHTLTNYNFIKNNKTNSYKILAAWLACGLDYKKVICYRQSDIPEITELLWFFSAIFPYNRLKLVHSFKEYKTNNKIINTATLTYPILMAADILISKAEIILVGKDQLQHLEIARKIAKKINQIKRIFTIPKAKIFTKLIKGTDGKKMSKSKKNIIDIFSKKKQIKKQIFKIKTQNKFLNEENKLLTDNLYNIYLNFAGSKKIKKKLNVGYQHAKEEFYSFLISKFKKERKLYKYYINKKSKLEKILKIGATKMKEIIQPTMKQVRNVFDCS